LNNPRPYRGTYNVTSKLSSLRLKHQEVEEELDRTGKLEDQEEESRTSSTSCSTSPPLGDRRDELGLELKRTGMEI